MTTWLQLRSHALIGVARRPVEPMTILGIDLDSSGTAAPEDQVLAAAALLGAERRAGARALAGRVAPLVPAEEARPPASPHAAQLLELVLGGAIGRGDGADVLLTHWFRCCAAAGARVPDHLVVDVLTTATTRPVVREIAPPALGATALWLASLRPDWAWVIESFKVTSSESASDDGVVDHTPLYEAWATATADERAELLARARSLDRALPRLLVESTWTVDNAGDREAALTILATTGDERDEPLFERALDDRSKKVRGVAQLALDGLTGSARAARLAAHLRPLVRHRGLLKGSLTVDLPDDPDAQAVRDGLGDPPALGRRMWWLQRLVTGAPLQLWCDLTNKSAEQIVRMGIEPPEVVKFWIAAAIAQRDVAWASALFAQTARPELLAVLPRGSATAIVERMARADLPLFSVVFLIDQLGGRWTPSLSDAVVKCFRKAAKSADEPMMARIAAVLPRFTSHLDSSVVPVLEAWRAATDDAALDRQLRHLIQHLSTLDAITAAFVTGAPKA